MLGQRVGHGDRVRDLVDRLAIGPLHRYGSQPHALIKRRQQTKSAPGHLAAATPARSAVRLPLMLRNLTLLLGPPPLQSVPRGAARPQAPALRNEQQGPRAARGAGR